MRYYENGGRWIILELDYEINYFNFNNVLKEIVKEFKNSKIKFEGWLYSDKIINIDGNNYIVYPGLNRIKLTFTTNKDVRVPYKRIKTYKKYQNLIRRLA